MSRDMSKQVTMSEVVRDQILEKSKDPKESHNTKHSLHETSIYYNFEVKSTTFPLIGDRK